MPFPFAAIAPWIPLMVSGGTALVGGVVKLAKKMFSKEKKNKTEGKPNSPYVLDDEDLKLIDTMTPDQKAIMDIIVPYMQEHGGEFLDELNKIDTSKLEELAAQQPAPFQNAEQLGFPQLEDIRGNIAQETDFAPIEEAARAGFQQQTVPQLAERFAGQGALKSSGFQGALGGAASDLERKLAALKSQYGLQRGELLGNLGQKQGALGLQRALGAGQLGNQRFGLGQAAQAQQFGQRQALANLGLQQNTQELQRRGQGIDLMRAILGQPGYQTIVPPASSGGTDWGSALLGAGLQGMGNINYADLFKAAGKV